MREVKTVSRATIADVARQASVSTATVSRVVNNTGPVAQETADRVWAAINELNYVPHMGARALASNKTRTLGLILPGISDYFFWAHLYSLYPKTLGFRDLGYLPILAKIALKIAPY